MTHAEDIDSVDARQKSQFMLVPHFSKKSLSARNQSNYDYSYLNFDNVEEDWKKDAIKLAWKKEDIPDDRYK